MEFGTTFQQYVYRLLVDNAEIKAQTQKNLTLSAG